MGQQPSRPTDMSKEVQVIGCGMSRKGTVSFGMACERLLDGPAYHVGQAIAIREEAHLLKWIDIVRHTPCKNEEDRAYVKAGLREQFKGYTATTDSPTIHFVEEQMELYPKAKIICSVRDFDDWWRSMEPVIKNANMPFLGFAFY